MEEILNADAVGKWSAQRRKMFAAEAWALVHDLHFRNSQGDPREVRGRLQEILDAGPTELEEFHRSPGLDVERLDERLGSYQQRKRSERWEAIAIEATVDEEIGSPRPLDRAEATRHLGWLALRLGRPTLARRYFRASLDGQPGDPRALSGLGLAAAGGLLLIKRSALVLRLFPEKDKTE